MSDLVPREKVTQQGVRAVGGIAGGIGLFVVAALVNLIPVVGGLGSTLLKIGGIGLLGLGRIQRLPVHTQPAAPDVALRRARVAREICR